MIQDAGEWIGNVLRSLRAASAGMLVLRALLAAACLGAIALVGPVPSFWRGLLVVLGVLAVAVPDSGLVAGFLVVLLAVWLATGHRCVGVVVALTACVALVHLLSVLCARGPLQAVVTPRSLGVRSWLVWLGGSAVGCALVLGVGALPASILPRGAAWIVLAALLLAAGVLGVLTDAKSHSR